MSFHDHGVVVFRFGRSHNAPSGNTAYLICWLEDYHSLHTCWMYLNFVVVLLGFSFHVLLVMSIERYLGAFYPIFHRTSLTRCRLLTLLGILIVVHTNVEVISIYIMNISRILTILIFIIAVFPLLVYLNFKLFKISREVRQKKAGSHKKRMKVDLKSISTCLFVVAYLVVLSIPPNVCFVFIINAENKWSSNAWFHLHLGKTMYTMNCTFNSLIFFWKNKVLRAEGIKVLKTLKDRLVGS